MSLIDDIIFVGMKLFSSERKRSLSREYQELLDNVDNAKNKRFPDYSDDEVILAEQKLENFRLSFASEFKSKVSELEVTDEG